MAKIVKMNVIILVFLHNDLIFDTVLTLEWFVEFY
jgi:hypothetical protein